MRYRRYAPSAYVLLIRKIMLGNDHDYKGGKYEYQVYTKKVIKNRLYEKSKPVVENV